MPLFQVMRHAARTETRTIFVSARVVLGARLLTAITVALALAAVLKPSDAAAQTTFTVNSLGDAIDVSPGDGTCGTAAGHCTLRAAVIEANSLPGDDTIAFGVLGAFALGRPGSGEDAALTGDLDITDDLTITGNGTTKTVVDAGGADRAFHVDPLGSGPRVRMTGLTVRDGDTPGEGGGILNAGRADLELRKAAVKGNAAGRGGGISNASYYARATLDDVVVDSNRATNHVGGLSNLGTAVLSDVTIDGNTAAGDTGGMSAGGVAILTNVTISHNTAYGATGSGWTGALAIGGSATISNTTISGNTGDPGGIWNGGKSSLTNVTIEGNTGAIFNCNNCGGSITLTNTIVSNSGFWSTINCYGTITSAGHNLDTGNACGFSAPGDIVNASAALVPLAKNGGRTRTHALAGGSPALDAGDPAKCPGADQRGVQRPQGAGCDIGAYERQTDALLVNSPVDAVDAHPGDGFCETVVQDECTLRAAVIEANAHPGPDRITFDRDGKFPLARSGAFEDAASTGDLDVTDDLVIEGRGTTQTIVNGFGKRFQDRIFHVDPSGSSDITVHLSDLTIANGHAFGSGGGVESGDSATLTLTRVVVQSNRASGALANLGGGIYNGGELDLREVDVLSNSVSGNSASVGGGIANAGGLSMTDTNIAENHAQAEGGGLDNGASGSASITRSTFSGNISGGSGGAIRNRGTVGLTNATISGNHAGPRGGGLHNTLGSATLTHVTITANSSGLAGGGISNSNGTTLLRSTLVANASAPAGQDCSGTITSDGGNLDSGTSCGFAIPTDISSANPQLDAPASNGSRTHTHALLAGSPAIDAARQGASCPGTDQRLVPRPQGNGCDIGAYERPHETGTKLPFSAVR
jgi:CSLREA domain-containing protein